MSGIVCAIRGGPNSQAPIARAMGLAKDSNLPLYFLYVINLDFLSRTSTSRVHTISREMRQMGEFILLTAQAKAAAEDISAQGIIRQGNVGQEIVDLCHELKADYLVLGRPQVQEEESVFTQDLLQEFIERTEEQTNARVILPDGSEA